MRDPVDRGSAFASPVVGTPGDKEQFVVQTRTKLAGGHAYYLGKDQRTVCVNLETRAEAWRTEKRFGASPGAS